MKTSKPLSLLSSLLILALLMLWCAVLIFADLWAGKRRKQRGLDR